MENALCRKLVEPRLKIAQSWRKFVEISRLQFYRVMSSAKLRFTQTRRIRTFPSYLLSKQKIVQEEKTAMGKRTKLGIDLSSDVDVDDDDIDEDDILSYWPNRRANPFRRIKSGKSSYSDCRNCVRSVTEVISKFCIPVLLDALSLLFSLSFFSLSLCLFLSLSLSLAKEWYLCKISCRRNMEFNAHIRYDSSTCQSFQSFLVISR